MKRTFAQRASAIKRKYPNHTRSNMERETMMEELQSLADEQERMKESMAVPDSVQFKMGGKTNTYANGGPAVKKYNSSPQLKKSASLEDKATYLYQIQGHSPGPAREQAKRDIASGLTTADDIDNLIAEEETRNELVSSGYSEFDADSKISEMKATSEDFIKAANELKERHNIFKTVVEGGDRVDVDFPGSEDPTGLIERQAIADEVEKGNTSPGSVAGEEIEKNIASDIQRPLTTKGALEVGDAALFDSYLSPIQPTKYQDPTTQTTVGPYNGPDKTTVEVGENPREIGTMMPQAVMDWSLGIRDRVNEEIVKQFGINNDYVDLYGYDFGGGQFRQSPSGAGGSWGDASLPVPDYLVNREEMLVTPERSTFQDDRLNERGVGTVSTSPSATGALLPDPAGAIDMTTPEARGKVALPQETKYPSRIGQFLGNNSENLMALAGGIAPIATNLANRRSLRDPSLIEPEIYRPSIKSTWYDPAGMDAILSNQLASARTSLANRGGNTDDYLTSLRSVNFDNAIARGTAQIEGQKINMQEQARIDALLSDANKVNATSLTQARIDQAQRQDNVDSLRRDYLTGVGENVHGVFSDISDAMLAKKLAPLMGKKETLDAIK
jgi:hypothetical protein